MLLLALAFGQRVKARVKEDPMTNWQARSEIHRHWMFAGLNSLFISEPHLTLYLAASHRVPALIQSGIDIMPCI